MQYLKPALILLFFITFSLHLFPAELYSQDTNTVKYFPLNIGNTWVYNGYYVNFQCQSTYLQKLNIDSMRVFNGHRYYKLNYSSRILTGGNCAYNQFITGYYRVDSISGNIYKYGENSACPVNPFDFLIDSLRSRTLDTTSICSGPQQTKKVARDTIMQDLFSVNRQSKYFEGGNFFEYSFFTRYVKDIGITEMKQGGMSISSVSSLKGCIINGTLYGDTNYYLVGIQSLAAETPVTYSLLQNYPNPFNPATVISFDIPKSSLVSLIVYDAMGREVKTLLNELLDAGTYSFDWDASTYPSGVYFYKLRANEFISTKKMVLIK